VYTVTLLLVLVRLKTIFESQANELSRWASTRFTPLFELRDATSAESFLTAISVSFQNWDSDMSSSSVNFKESSYGAEVKTRDPGPDPVVADLLVMSTISSPMIILTPSSALRTTLSSSTMVQLVTGGKGEGGLAVVMGEGRVVVMGFTVVGSVVGASVVFVVVVEVVVVVVVVGEVVVGSVVVELSVVGIVVTGASLLVLLLSVGSVGCAVGIVVEA